MRVDFCRFTDIEGQPVYINPLLARCIQRADADGTTSRLFLGQRSLRRGHCLAVRGRAWPNNRCGLIGMSLFDMWRGRAKQTEASQLR
jgi:hypothetical protein